MHLLADSAPAYTTKTTLWLLAEFWILADWPPYLLDVNSLVLSISIILQVQATPHANLATLHLSIAAEWDWLMEVSAMPASHSASAWRLLW
jgi:hypothetical protein